MRIIGGSAKGRRILTPSGKDTRPTQDRIRESIFDILQGMVQGADVLDLFAGSGALGLEAASRGARWVVSVDHAQAAMACIQQNVAKLGFESRVLALKCDWTHAMIKLQQIQAKFDLIFLDPPYLMKDIPMICKRLVLQGLLKMNALVIIEHHKSMLLKLPDYIYQKDIRNYGDTVISFYGIQEGIFHKLL